MINPCEDCKARCPYRLFIDCPIWLAWAQAENEMEDNYETMGNTEDTDDSFNV